MGFSSHIVASRTSASIRERGRSYISRVKMVRSKPGEIHAMVFGTYPYHTSISLSKKGEYIDECDCPYGPSCKHTVALAYAIERDPGLIAMLDSAVRVPQMPLSAQGVLKTLAEIDRIYHENERLTPPAHHQKENHGIYYRFHTQVMYGYLYYKNGANPFPYLTIETGRYIVNPQTGKLTLRNSKTLSETVYEKEHLAPVDEAIIRTLSYSLQRQSRYYYGSAGTPLHDDIIDELFSLLAQVPMVVWEDGTPLEITQERAELTLACKQTADGYTWEPALMYKNERHTLQEENLRLFEHKPVIAKVGSSLYRLQNELDLQTFQPALSLKNLATEALQNPSVVDQLLSISQFVPLELPVDWTSDALVGSPIPLLLLDRDTTPWTVEPFMTYGDHRFSPHTTAPLFFTSPSHGKLCKRDLQKERDEYLQLCTLLKKQEQDAPFNILYEDREHLFHTVFAEMPAHWQIALKNEEMPVKRNTADFHFDQTSSINWLDIDGTVKIDDSTLSLSDILDEILTEEPFLTIKGKSFLLSPLDKKKLLQLSAYYDRKERKVRLSRLHIGALDELAGTVDTAKLHAVWKQTLNAVRSFQTLAEVPHPKIFHAKLRPYQQEGVNWLSFLKEYQFGGILADDMGLGKTIQALTILARAHENTAVTRPSLIVAPTSVIYNWQEEIQQFTPGLTAHIYFGKQRSFPQDKSTHVIITSYALLWRDREQFTKRHFHYVILDEAHYIKNHQSQTAKTAHLISADHRLSLTGTPLENNLTELWSQCAFVNPGLFTSLDHFKQTFVTPIEKYQSQEAKQHLQRLMKPFLLRRLKQDVMKELPPKIEQTIWCEMDGKQRTLYDAMKQYYQAKVLKIVEQKGIKKSQIEILEALLRLRQICCHPDLLRLKERKSYPFLPAKLRDIHVSTKLESVIELLKTAISEGHKVLLFSQFVSMLQILQTELNIAKISSLMLTGQSNNRQELIKTFQSSTSHSVFLLSLKAGGTGLNLTAADYVIHYDPWWNPAVETQATDRAHRIGQTKSVSVYKMLVKDSIEEKIQALQEKKKGLIEDIIGGVGRGKGLTREDLEFLLK